MAKFHNSPIIKWIRKIYNIKLKLQIFAQLLQDTQSKSVPGFWKAIWEIFFGVLQNPWKFAWVKNWTNRKICKNVFWVLKILFKILLVLKVKTPLNFSIFWTEKNRKMTGNCITRTKKARKMCRIAATCRKNFQKFSMFWHLKPGISRNTPKKISISSHKWK